MKKHGIEVRKEIAEDFEISPKYYDNGLDGNASLLQFAAYGMFFPDGVDNKPVCFFRNLNQDKFRWAGIINIGDGPLDPHTPFHVADIAQKDAVVEPYRKVSDNPAVYQINSKDPFCEYRFYEGGGVWKEAGILDLEVTPFPYAIVGHTDSPYGFCFFHQFVTFTGTYEGKPVTGMGAYDRSLMPDRKDNSKVIVDLMSYIGACYGCIREDGRRESAFVNVLDRNGHGLAYYFLEGEEPIVTDEVYLDAEWSHLPYAPGDPTVVFTKGTWRFADKEIHLDGKWGGKGYTLKPRMEKVGQSHMYGTWYEGKEPYKQLTYYSMNENMQATDERISKMGWKVVD